MVQTVLFISVIKFSNIFLWMLCFPSVPILKTIHWLIGCWQVPPNIVISVSVKSTIGWPLICAWAEPGGATVLSVSWQKLLLQYISHIELKVRGSLINMNENFSKWSESQKQIIKCRYPWTWATVLLSHLASWSGSRKCCFMFSTRGPLSSSTTLNTRLKLSNCETNNMYSTTEPFSKFIYKLHY